MKDQYLNSSTLKKTVDDLIAELTGSLYRHEDWKLCPERAALLVLDMQNYFLDPASHAFTPSAPAIIPNIEKLIIMARQNQMPVIFTRHVNDPSNAGRMDKWWKDLIRGDSYEAQISETLRLYDDKSVGREEETRRQGDKETVRSYGSKKAGLYEDKIIVKNQYDAFYNTDLEEYLRLKNIEQVIITGLLANLCCETTARSTFVRGFEVFFPVDATAAYNREFHISTFRNLGFGFCPILNTSDLINSLNEL